jgi:hypothetical protein
MIELPKQLVEIAQTLPADMRDLLIKTYRIGYATGAMEVVNEFTRAHNRVANLVRAAMP